MVWPSMKWLRAMRSQVQIPVERKNNRWFFPSVLALVDRVTCYFLLVGCEKYVVELVEVRGSWSGHHDHQNKTKNDL